MQDVLVYVRGILTGVGQLSTWVGSDNGDRCGVLQSESRYKQLAQGEKVDKSLYYINTNEIPSEL